ncbi:hypothetical protein [Pseudomonas sp. NPDC086278]|uniref:hypothetical protein n=1 Tax=Pseudomonas sp. NPDC086278 TaxID=3390646 RepID=UPI003D065FFC
MSVTNATWQSEWKDRDARDAEAKAANEATERTREQAYQLSIDKAVQDGQQLLIGRLLLMTSLHQEPPCDVFKITGRYTLYFI